jgi:hypothetical protein
MSKIEKQILFELKKELSEGILDSAVGAVTGSIPGKVAGSVKDMVFRDASQNQTAAPKETQLLQKRFEPFQYPVSLMVGKFNIFANEATKAAEQDEGEDPKNKAQLERKARIYNQINGYILKPLAQFIDEVSEGASNFNFENFYHTVNYTFAAIPAPGTVALPQIDEISVPKWKDASTVPSDSDTDGNINDNIQEINAEYKLALKTIEIDDFSIDTNPRNFTGKKDHVNKLVKQIREFLRPLALLVQKKGKETRTKITQTDLVQALDAKGIKENRNEIIRLIVELSTQAQGDFDIQEFLKDPIGQSKKWLETPATESNVNDTAETKKSLARKIAMSYYSKKLEPIIDKLPQDIAKDPAKLTTIKQELAKAFITGSNTVQELKIELAASEDGVTPAETMEFNWTGTTFERVIKGWERFLKAKGMEGFSHIEKFAKLANEVIDDDNYENFMKKPETTMRTMATAQMSHQLVYTTSPFTQDTFARAELFENETDQNEDRKILKLAYYIAVHKYGKKLKPILLQMEDNDIDTNNFKDIVAPWVLLSYLRKDFKRFNIKINDETTLKFQYNKAGNIAISGLRNLTDLEKDMVNLINEQRETFVALFGLKYKFEGTKKQAKQLGLSNLKPRKQEEITDDFLVTGVAVNQRLQDLIYTEEEGEPTLSFSRKKDSKAPIDYLYNVYKLFTGKNAEAHRNNLPHSRVYIDRLVKNSTKPNDIFRDLRELFDWYQDKEALDNSDFGKIGKFINKELRSLIKTENTKRSAMYSWPPEKDATYITLSKIGPFGSTFIEKGKKITIDKVVESTGNTQPQATGKKFDITFLYKNEYYTISEVTKLSFDTYFKSDFLPLEESIDRKLQLLINNYINNRKQKWQRKTT